MKWPNQRRTANEGVLCVQTVVNEHGSIYRSVPQETDVGVDAYIELVQDNIARGTLVGVQIKSGESYVAKSGDAFEIPVDQRHLKYWDEYPIPIIIVAYSPACRICAWVPIGEYVSHAQYHGQLPITRVKIPFRRKFDCAALEGPIAVLVRANADRRILIRCIDQCLTGNAEMKHQGLSVLGAHPDSCDSSVLALVARKLLFDANQVVSDEAVWQLSFQVGRFRWSENPNNIEERNMMSFACQLCGDFTADECRCLIERVDDEAFKGPHALGERVFDLLNCCERSRAVMDEIAMNRKLPMKRRINALYMYYDCDDADLLDYRELADDPSVGDVYREMYGEELEELEKLEEL